MIHGTYGDIHWMNTSPRPKAPKARPARPLTLPTAPRAWKGKAPRKALATKRWGF